MIGLWEWVMVPIRIYWRFLDNHGFALASNIAFSMLLSIFPFLLLITGVTVWIGGDALGVVLQNLLIVLLPDAIASILQPDVDAVIAERTSTLLSISAVIFLVTLTSMVETLREGLNRAYGYYERRSLLSRRFAGLVAIFGACVVLLAVAAALFFAPVAWNIAMKHVPQLADFDAAFDVARFCIAIPILAGFLVASHRWLPMRQIAWRDLWPGVLTTIILWYLAGEGYNYYLSHFAQYARVYAGLAGVVATLIFLQIVSMIFLYGAEVNAWRIRWRRIHKTRGEGRKEPGSLQSGALCDEVDRAKSLREDAANDDV